MIEIESVLARLSEPARLGRTSQCVRNQGLSQRVDIYSPNPSIVRACARVCVCVFACVRVRGVAVRCLRRKGEVAAGSGRVRSGT